MLLMLQCVTYCGEHCKQYLCRFRCLEEMLKCCNCEELQISFYMGLHYITYFSQLHFAQSKSLGIFRSGREFLHSITCQKHSNQKNLQMAQWSTLAAKRRQMENLLRCPASSCQQPRATDICLDATPSQLVDTLTTQLKAHTRSLKSLYRGVTIT